MVVPEAGALDVEPELTPFETDEDAVLVFTTEVGGVVELEDEVALNDEEVVLLIARACTVCCCDGR